MPRFVAFLRAINIGSHIVKMAELRKSFEALGLREVETFIASGNVLFESRMQEPALRTQIAARLEADLGYEVGVFLRSAAEVRAIAAREPFAPAAYRTADSRLFVAFVADELAPEIQQALVAASSATDEFQVLGREIYWLCHVRANESPFSGAKLEKAVRTPATVRNMNTVRRLAEKLAAGSPAKERSSSARRK